jgi:tetratricopeptide (TPR) repeat protein
MRSRIQGLCVAVGLAVCALAADDLAAEKETAVRLYDQGTYDQARTALHQLDDASALDGPLLYRLFFCEKATGHEEDARKALDRARTALETGIPATRTLEDSFYLANTYANLGRPEDARNVARDATSRIESGKLAQPTTAMGNFQLGKLYQDQGRTAEASKFFGKAVDTFDVTGGRYGGNVRWALRFLGNGAFARRDFAASEASFVKLTGMGGADLADWDALAAARVRLGKYTEAGDAWRAQVRLDPANADDARYAARLADAAATIKPLPESASGATAFAQMSRVELESFLKTQSDAALASQARIGEAMAVGKDGAPTKPIDPKLRSEESQKLGSVRKLFTAAALEYAIKQFGIRETAFREGYAVLIFQDRAWEVPPDPDPAAEGSAQSGS